MIEIEARLDELERLGLAARTRLVSGPQGPRVVLDGTPVLLLCGGNYLGFADHPAVREAAADAAMRWGVGAGAARTVSGTMTIHRRLEERLAAFTRREAALLFGSGYLAGSGVVAALARPGDVVFSDELNHPAIVDGCRLSRADVFIYEHGDVEHLEWGLREAEGRGALIVTEGVFALGGDVAPLPELVDLAHRYDVRLAVDESHGLGTVGPGGRGAVADAGVEDEVDVIVGSLGKALGACGGYVACDQLVARYLTSAARPLLHSTALAPPAVAGALAALTLLEEQPRRVEKLQTNALLLRAELTAAGFAVDAEARTPIIPLVLGDASGAARAADLALDRGVFVQPMLPPAVSPDTAGLRVSVTASHAKSELRDAARALAQAAVAAGVPPRAPAPPDAALAGAPRPAAAVPRARPPRHATLWDDGDGELWVERRRPAGARPSDQRHDDPFGAPPFDGAFDVAATPPVAQRIFDIEAGDDLIERAA